MPRSQIATSAFTGTDGTQPADFTALNTGDGALTIDTNRIESTTSFGATDANDSRWTGAGTFTAEQYAKIVVTGISNPGGINKLGVVLRASVDTGAGRDLYRVYVLEDNTTAIVIQKILDGTPTQLNSTNVGAFTNGDTVEGEIEEITGTTTIRSYRNGTLVATATDSTSPITATGAPGVCGAIGFGPGMFGDDWEAGNLTSSGTVNTEVLEDTISITDEPLDYVFYNRMPESTIVLTDEFIATLVGTIARILTDSIDVTDGAVFSVYRNRLLQDTIIVSEGANEQYITSNIVADDEIAVTDEYLAQLIWRRVLGDSIGITDEALASIIGQNVLLRVLTDSIETVDDALAFCQRHRVGESLVLTADEVVKVLQWTRELTDSIELADENLTALQRFIMLSDALSVIDSAIASVNPTPDDFVTPTIRVGFDQPRIDIGGYSVT